MASNVDLYEIFSKKDLIHEIYEILSNDRQFDVNMENELQMKFKDLKEFVEHVKSIDFKTFYYFKFHYHKLISVYYKRKDEYEKAREENKVSLNFAIYENELDVNDIKISLQNNCFINLNENLDELNFDSEVKNLLDEALNKIVSSEFKQKYDQLSKFVPTNMDEYKIYNELHLDLTKHVEEILTDLEPRTNEEKKTIRQIELLLSTMNYTRNIRRKQFMKNILNLDTKEREKFFFGKFLAPDTILSCFRKYAIFFHPDKNNNLPDLDLCTKVYQFLSDTKEKLIAANTKDNLKYHYNEALDLFESGLDYYHAYNKNWSCLKNLAKSSIDTVDPILLKNMYIQNIEQAYEKFKAACWMAEDTLDCHNQMLECRINMTACLFMQDMYIEAQLVSLTCVKLTENVSYRDKFSAEQKNFVNKLFNAIQSKNINSVIYLFSFNSKNINNDENEAKLCIDKNVHSFQIISECLKKGTEYNTLKSYTDTNERKIFTNRLEGAGRIVAVIPSFFSVGAKVYDLQKAVSPILEAVSTLTSVIMGTMPLNTFIYPILILTTSIPKARNSFWETWSAFKNAKEQLNIRHKLDDMMLRAQKAHSESQYKLFLEILSEKYDDINSLINVKFLKPYEIYDTNEVRFSIDIEKIKKTLFDFGFRPEGIAYLLLLLHEALIGYPNWKDFSEINQSKHQIIATAENLLNATINDPPEDNKNLINLTAEAKKLDEHLNKLRRNILFESGGFGYIENKFNKLKNFISSKGIIDENLLIDRKISSFQSRLNEVKCIAAINKFILNLCEGDDTMAKSSLEKVKNLLNTQFNYISKPLLRFEVLKDFIWLMDTSYELMESVYDDDDQNDSLNICNQLTLESSNESIGLKLSSAIDDEHEAFNSLPVQRRYIEKLLHAKAKYKDIINYKNKEKINNYSEILANALIGHARCCVYLAKYTKVLDFIKKYKDNRSLTEQCEYWIYGSIAKRKGTSDYENANEFMTEAKCINSRNKLLIKEAKKLDNLLRMNTKEYLWSLSSEHRFRESTLFDSSQSVTKIESRGDKLTYKILSIDGGGIRGIIPAIWLHELELELKKPISSLFDMIAGTSTGAIIGAALSLPESNTSRLPKYSAENIINIYNVESNNIFQQNGSFKHNFFYARYQTPPRLNLFKKYFQNFRLSDSIADLVIPVVTDNNRTTTFEFSSFSDSTKNFFYYDVLMAATASPPYFGPYSIPDFDAKFIDGGVTFNNPSEIAYQKAIKIHGTEKISILSLGTGTIIPDVNLNSNKSLSRLFYKSNQLKDYVLPPVEGDIDEKMYSYLGNKYSRWQIIIENEIKFNNEYDQQSRDYLIDISRQYIEDLRDVENNEFDRVVKMFDNESD